MKSLFILLLALPALAGPCAVPAEKCPKEKCEILSLCNGKKLCQPLRENSKKPACGQLGTFDATIPCCKGLTTGCGEYINFKCVKATASPPICLNCGNNFCDRDEQDCNCPEDCEVTKVRPQISYSMSNTQIAKSPSKFTDKENTGVEYCLNKANGSHARTCIDDWRKQVFGQRTWKELKERAQNKFFAAHIVELGTCFEIVDPGMSECIFDVAMKIKNKGFCNLIPDLDSQRMKGRDKTKPKCISNLERNQVIQLEEEK